MAAIRQQINIAASPRAVWRALTTEEGVKTWWADDARIDTEVSKRIVLSTEGDDGAPVKEIGTFLELRPTRRIEIKWDGGTLKGARQEFHVAKDGDETRVSVVVTGGPLDDDAIREAVDAQWRQALHALRDSMEGGGIPAAEVAAPRRRPQEIQAVSEGPQSYVAEVDAGDEPADEDAEP